MRKRGVTGRNLQLDSKSQYRFFRLHPLIASSRQAYGRFVVISAMANVYSKPFCEALATILPIPSNHLLSSVSGRESMLKC